MKRLKRRRDRKTKANGLGRIRTGDRRRVKSSFCRMGRGTHFWSEEDKDNWFHFPLTLPSTVNGSEAQLMQVCVVYQTYVEATITDIHVYDGAEAIKLFKDLNLTGDHIRAIDASNSWTIDPAISVKFGVGISIGVKFGKGKGAVAPRPGILFGSAGIELA